MEQPEGFVKRGHKYWVCLLKTSIYGLRQSPRNWNNTLHLGRIALLPIYVDDILLVGKEEDVDFVDTELTERFKMKYLEDVNYLLGLQIHYDPETHVSFKQTKYIQDITAKFNMGSAYSVSIPMTVDGAKLADATPEDHEKSVELPYRILVGCL
ncbi:hypothetical protein PC110_g2596 [Phytophthora cactorum]|uniref:Reverse transcriptase Ty1/copia-type domain-containing protein n=1 Tax=Phytophthora cactorum TaxID=29920 RepID=A0A329SZ39_9STRA|nr:hypothetical protein PC110_g2596 [Phytophthora cactorum]